MKSLTAITFVTSLVLFVLTACDKSSPSFTLGLNPANLSLRQGQSSSITVTLTPKDSFKGAVTVTLESTVLTAAPLTVAEGATSGTLTVTAKADAPLGVSTAKITGSSGKLTESSDLQVTITSKSFAVVGNVPDYSAGEATIKAQLIVPDETRYVVGQGNLQADGSFTLSLEDVPAQYLEAFEVGLGVECSNVAPTPTTVKVVGLLEMALEQNGTLVGFLFQVSSPEFLEDYLGITPTGATGRIVLRLFSDTAAEIEGTCSEPDSRYNLPTTIDLSLEKGWNTVVVEVSTTTLSLTNSVAPVPWFYGN